MLRCFIAFSLPASCRALLARVQRRLQHHGLLASWAPEANLHLSLAFLGDVAEPRLADVMDCMREAADGTQAFSFEIEDLGFFGASRAPRVLWAGIRRQPKLYELQTRLCASLRAHDFPIEDRPYRPHITLARFKPQHRQKSTIRRADLCAPPWLSEIPPVQALELHLMQSLLEAQGVSYACLFRQPLETPA